MVEFKQVYGVYDRVPAEGGQFRSVKVGEQVNIWSVGVEDSKLLISRNGEQRKYKIVDSAEYVYRILKTQIQAINGAEGLYKHICEWGNEAAFKHDVFRKLDNIWAKVKPIKA